MRPRSRALPRLRALGTFRGEATFGAGSSETVLTSAGGEDLFVAKYNASGALLWAKRAGGEDVDRAWGIALDSAGNSYISGNLGRFTTVADFGPGVTLRPTGGNGDWAYVIVAKYDTNGNAAWATNLGLGGSGYAVDVDASGNSYIGGCAPDPVLGGCVVTTWKVGAGGAPVWVRQSTGVNSGSGYGISVDSSGNSYAVGQFFGTATFGTGEPNQTTLTSSVNGDLFVSKYDTAGSLMWARQSVNAPGSFGVRGNGISTDSAGNSYLAGVGGAILGSDGANKTTVADGFVAKCDTVGNLAWAKSATAENGWLHAVAHNSAGQTYISGRSLPAVPGSIFLAKYDLNGGLLWARPLASSADAPELRGSGISLDGTGNAYVAGTFSGSCKQSCTR